ncbi:MAG: hypothetical protein HDT28_04885 [Clostridiales bacterium]|nr:hypothetical protein [Clostridiales bacterium]
MKNEELKTEFRKKREQRDDAIVARFEELMSHKGAMAMAVMKVVAYEFGLYSTTAIWAARKRVAKRRMEENR